MFKEYGLGKSTEDFVKTEKKITKDFQEIETKYEDSLRFKLDLLYDLVEGEHTWTIRYKPNVICMPVDMSLSQRNKLRAYIPVENDEWHDIGYVIIPRMAVGHVRDWPKDHESIAGSGWKSKKHMVKGIFDIYEPIYGNRLTPDDILVAYALEGFRLYQENVEGWEQAKKLGLSARKWQAALNDISLYKQFFPT